MSTLVHPGALTNEAKPSAKAPSPRLVRSSLRAYKAWLRKYLLTSLIVIGPSALLSLSTVSASDASLQTLSAVASICLFLALVTLAERQFTGSDSVGLRALFYGGTASFVRFSLTFAWLFIYVVFCLCFGWARCVRYVWRSEDDMKRVGVRRTMRVVTVVAGALLSVVVFLVNVLLWYTLSNATSISSYIALIIVIPAVYVGLRYSPALIAVALTEVTPIAAVRQMRRATRGRVRRLIGRQLLLGITIAGCAVVILLPVFGLSLLIHTQSALNGLYAFLFYMLVVPFIVIYQVRLYHEVTDRQVAA